MFTLCFRCFSLCQCFSNERKKRLENNWSNCDSLRQNEESSSFDRPKCRVSARSTIFIKRKIRQTNENNLRPTKRRSTIDFWTKFVRVPCRSVNIDTRHYSHRIKSQRQSIFC